VSKTDRDALERAAAAGDPKAIADRADNALARADQRLVELGLVAPKRTRAERRARKAARRQPNDGHAGQTDEQRRRARRAKARRTRKGKR